MQHVDGVRPVLPFTGKGGKAGRELRSRYARLGKECGSPVVGDGVDGAPIAGAGCRVPIGTEGRGSQYDAPGRDSNT
ncbi:hypothetical protein SHKM778_44960 [Streptomyces sp. KM77-8]|uniref:Uncharacterized protein n=1 Tax=Streptomyces haneummycinicus TaxID=3074435 RepID=A0AAT9HLG1_9ACTN